MDQTFIARAKAEREARMFADPRGAQAKRIHDACMAQHRERLASSKPQPRHLHVVAHAGASTEHGPYRHVTAADIEAVQARELAEASAEIMRTFMAKGRKPAAEPQTVQAAESELMRQFTARKPAATLLCKE